jgi:hypothetical protein
MLFRNWLPSSEFSADGKASVIANMRARVAQCRRLAQYINDPRTTEALLKMAQEGEADIQRLEADTAKPEGA